MLTVFDAFPNATPELTEALDKAPRSVLAVNADIDFKRALEREDRRYVPTAKARADKFQKHFFSTFGYDPAGPQFVPVKPAKHVLFFGHVGSGKSTELARLAADLHHPDRYWVVRLNVLDFLDPHDVKYTDIWLAVAQELVAQLERDGIVVPSVVVKGFEDWFKERVLTQDQLKELSAELKTEASASTGLPFIGTLLARFTASVRTGSTYRESIRTVVRNTFGLFADALNQLLHAATSAVAEAGKGRQTLLVIDGPDRFRGENLMDFFVQDANQLTMIECVSVYAAPMSLKSSGASLALFDLLVLPMIKLREFDGTRTVRPDAYNAMREVLLKRCHYSLFDALDTLDALIDYSGGHLRDALRLLSYACVEADGAQLTRVVVDAAAQRLASDFRDWLLREDYGVLAAAAHEPENTGGSEAITRLVEGGALLEYNTGAWREPHPVLRLLPAFRKAFAAPAPAGP